MLRPPLGAHNSPSSPSEFTSSGRIAQGTRRWRWLALALVLSVTCLAPTRAHAQPSPGRAGQEVAKVFHVLEENARAAVVAFTGETPGFLQPPASPIVVSAAQRTRRALVAVSGVAAVGFLLALVVLVSAQSPLEGVARAAERDVSRSFWTGLLAQALAAPILVVLSLALALTIIFIPAIPFAVLAWALAYAGATTLGLLAVAVVLGRALLGRSTRHNRSALLSSLMVGLAVLTTLWLIAAIFVSVPTAGILVRILALGITWVAATVGLGGVVLSRAGTTPAHMDTTTEAAVPSWQTPTPVFGVVAARKPTPVTTTSVE
jgi:hypothetical protein